MPKAVHKVVVIGHKNPDTDSICSAIAYAALKNTTSDLVCEPRRAGALNQETSFVLQKFGVQSPRMCDDVYPKIRDVDYREEPAIGGDTSLRGAWARMRDRNIDTLAVVDNNQHLAGLITVKDIAVANMDIFDTTILAQSKTSYRNILETLDGKMLVGDANQVVESGRIMIGSANPETMERVLNPGDIVLVSNRSESQLCAIEMQASLIIVTQGAAVSKAIQNLASANNVAIMTVPHDTYAAGKLISQCAPISHYMTQGNLLKCHLETPVAEVTREMAKVRHSYFPVLDSAGKYCGMLSRRNIINRQKRRLILVDHNESTQAVEGYQEAEILEIIDHHRIGNLETSGPVYFRNQPVGCTATIVTQMYAEECADIPQPIAGLLLGAILSDTLAFRSPTCTPLDKRTAERLAPIAGVEIERFAAELFEAGERLTGKTAEEVFLQDFKIFVCNDIRFGVAQGNYMTQSNLQDAKALLQPYLQEAMHKQNVEDLFVILTDIKAEQSVILSVGNNTARVLAEGFGATPEADGTVLLPGVVSRKKQFIPQVMQGYQAI